MTFGAMAAWQAWLLLAAAGALSASLFLLKLRPPRVIVPSLLLWRRVLEESRELTLWERIRRAVSLVVTVAIALVLALAMTRPMGVAGAATGGRTLVVLDSSWSMLTRTRSGETRWDRAVAEARRLAAAASGHDVALATTADGLVEGPTADLALIETALARLVPAGGDGTSWPRLAGVDAVHFITDGAVARPLHANVVPHSVFEPAANVAITAFDVRPSMTAEGAGDAYLEIANYAPAAQRVHVTLGRGTLGTPVLEAGEVLRQVVALPRGTLPALRARVDAPENALGIDDEAFAWVERAQPLSVVVVGQHTDWLRTLLERDPDVRATFIDPSSYQSPQEATDVVIFDRWTPPEAPARPALYVAPREAPWLGAGRIDERAPQWHSIGSHPVVRGVDPFTLAIDRARSYQGPALVPVARSARGTALAYVRASPGSRLVLLTFGPDESNLSSAPGFPVLIANALDWLARPVAGPARRPGLVAFDDAIARIVGPRDIDVPVVRMNGASIAVLPVPGLYVAEGGGSRSTIAVNAGDPHVSNVARTSLPADQAHPVASGMWGRPWWLYCVLAAFVLVLAEWWTWQRRITV
jgi:hypothetical protein